MPLSFRTNWVQKYCSLSNGPVFSMVSAKTWWPELRCWNISFCPNGRSFRRYLAKEDVFDWYSWNAQLRNGIASRPPCLPKMTTQLAPRESEDGIRRCGEEWCIFWLAFAAVSRNIPSATSKRRSIAARIASMHSFGSVHFPFCFSWKCLSFQLVVGQDYLQIPPFLCSPMEIDLFLGKFWQKLSPDNFFSPTPNTRLEYTQKKNKSLVSNGEITGISSNTFTPSLHLFMFYFFLRFEYELFRGNAGNQNVQFWQWHSIHFIMSSKSMSIPAAHCSPSQRKQKLLNIASILGN